LKSSPKRFCDVYARVDKNRDFKKNQKIGFFKFKSDFLKFKSNFYDLMYRRWPQFSQF